MKKFIILMTIFGLAFSNNYFSGLSHATSDNLDALSMNPAGLGVDRDIQFGLGIDQDFLESKKIGIGLKHNQYAASFLIDENGEYDYTIGFGQYFPKSNLYYGQTYSANKDLKTGLLIRPFNWLSTGLTHIYNLDSEINGLRFASAFKPLGNRLTFSVDLFHDDLSKIENTDFGYTANIDVKVMNGIHVIAGYNNNEEVQLGLSFNTSNLSVLGFGDGSENSHPNISFRYSSQEMKGIELPSFKKEDNLVLNFVKLELDHLFIEEPIKEKKGFNFDFPNVNPLGMFSGGNNTKFKQLSKFLNKIDLIKNDESIDGLVIHLKSLGGSMSKLIDIRNALQSLKDSGKKIIIYSDYISNAAYLVASVADEIYVPELSGVDLKGLSVEVEFYKDLLDTLGIVFEVEQISPYKSALDPFVRNSMSPEMKENLGMLFDDIYEDFVNGISNGRGWSNEKTKKIIDNGPYLESQAIDAGLINGTMYPDEFDNYINNYNDKKVVKSPFNAIHEKVTYDENWVENHDKIAVVYAVGGIQLGKSQRGFKGPSTVMGNETISKAIKAARLDDDVKGIVLRIDSGGGSALSSDLMWREIYKTTVADTNNVKPFVASMSGVAASGGYYIACQADKIMASPTTITGSIGVISGRPNLSGLKEKVGIKTDGLKYGKHSDYYSGNKLWNDEERGILRDGILHVYGKFLKRVADGRDALDSLGVHEVGIGKVWTGKKAKELNLVDEIGTMEDAINLTADLAGLEPNNFEIDEYPKTDKLKGLKLMESNMNLFHTFKFNGTIKEIQETLQSIPDFENDHNQMVLPYRIIIR